MEKRKLVFERFKSLESFIDTMEKRPLNEAFKREIKLSSERKYSNDDKNPWSGTKTYNEAAEILKTGYREPLEKMKKAILKIGETDKNARPRPKNDFVGYTPNVPNYLMNVPNSMITKDKFAPKTKTIHLLYSFCAASQTTTADMIKGGINFISLVNSLEKQGYRVKIDAIFTTLESKTVAAVMVNLKDYSQHTNLLKLAFPLVHPSMLRRFSFKWLETTPELTDNHYTYGYGKPLNFHFRDNLQQETDFLKEYGIIKGENTYYCNVYTAIRANSVEQLAEQMQIIK